jgi:hypothetical protein
MFLSIDCNMVAHVCGKQVSRENGVQEWLVPPPTLLDLLATYCNQIMI